MITGKREIPIHIRKHQALSRRLAKTHPSYQRVYDQTARYLAGYHGEKTMDYFLNYIPKEKYQILHGLRIYDGTYYFQMDLLILSPCYLLVVEVKNISGTIIYDPEFNQLIRISQDKEEGFSDPLLQVERQKKLLEGWLDKKFNLQDIPIETLVVFSNSSTIIKTTSRKIHLSEKIIHGEKLPTKIEEYSRIHRNEKVSNKNLKKLVKNLVKGHEPLNTDILVTYGVKTSDLIVGVQCQGCNLLPMNRLHGTWRCPQCKWKHKEAHTWALIDYALLISPNLTNKDARDFLNIGSDHVAKRLLSSLNLPTTGNNKGRAYNLTQLLKE